MMTDPVLQAVLDHAAVDFPREACGLILRDDTGFRVLPCENTAPDPHRSFLIDPVVFAQYDDHIAAIYHSHPNGAAKPSQTDIESSARCNVPFLIVGWPTGDVHIHTPTHAYCPPYEGRPFVYGVSDCMTLVCDYYRHELGIDIVEGERRHWGWWTARADGSALIDWWDRQGFIRVDSPRQGDVILMSLLTDVPNHAAIYVGDSRILHHPSAGNLSRVEMYGHYWRSRTHSILRHPSR